MGFKTMNAFEERVVKNVKRAEDAESRLGKQFPVVTAFRKIAALEASLESRGQPGYHPSNDKFGRYKDATVAKLIEKEGMKFREFWNEPNPDWPIQMKTFEDGYGWSERRDSEGKIGYTTVVGPNGFVLNPNEDSVKALAILRWGLTYQSSNWKFDLSCSGIPTTQFIEMLSNYNGFCYTFLCAIGEDEIVRLLHNDYGDSIREKVAGIVMSRQDYLAERVANSVLGRAFALGDYYWMQRKLVGGENSIALAKFLRERIEKTVKELGKEMKMLGHGHQAATEA